MATQHEMQVRCKECRLFFDESVTHPQGGMLYCTKCWHTLFKICAGPGCFNVVGAMWTYCGSRCEARRKRAENGR